MTAAGTAGRQLPAHVEWVDARTPHEGAHRAAALFEAAFGVAPEGVWSAPGRVNLMGEHTDYNAGLCLPIAPQHRTYAAVSRRGDTTLRLVSAQREDSTIDSCVPFGAGLSSSTSLEAALAMAIDELSGTPLAGTARGLAVIRDACARAEREAAGANTGGLDQSASLFTSEGHALLLDMRDGTRRHIPFDPEQQAMTLLVIDTRAEHALADGQYGKRRHLRSGGCAVGDRQSAGSRARASTRRCSGRV